MRRAAAVARRRLQHTHSRTHPLTHTLTRTNNREVQQWCAASCRRLCSAPTPGSPEEPSRSRSRSSSSSSSGRHGDFEAAEDFEVASSRSAPSAFAPFHFIHDLFVSSVTARLQGGSGSGGSGSGESESGSPSDELLHAVGSREVMQQLEHPLLKKYRFDPMDFVAGARMAHERILECLFAPDLRLRLDGYVRSCQSYELLEEVCSEEALESFLDHASSGHGGDDMFRVLGERLTDDITIDKIKVVLEARQNNELLQPHVIVIADVSFVSTVELEYAQQLEEDGREKQRSHSPRVSQWQFSGCISGGGKADEEEVEWKVHRVLSHGGAFYD